MAHALEEKLIDIIWTIKTNSEALLAKQKQRSINAVVPSKQVVQKLEMQRHRKQLKACPAYARKHRGQAISALAFKRAFVEDMDSGIRLSRVTNEHLRQSNKNKWL